MKRKVYVQDTNQLIRNRGFTRQNFSSKNSGGFMQIVFLAVIIIAGLAYFNIDLHAVAQMPIVKQIIAILSEAWINYILPLFKFLTGSAIDLLESASSTATSTATTTAQILGK
ncbi:MAG: hypothetical protein WC791_01240 [Candidatus Paceibacterota bacterium]|jgi:hypothetical protein